MKAPVELNGETEFHALSEMAVVVSRCFLNLSSIQRKKKDAKVGCWMLWTTKQASYPDYDNAIFLAREQEPQKAIDHQRQQVRNLRFCIISIAAC